MTHDCMTKYNGNLIFKFADDTTVVSQAYNNEETNDWKEIKIPSVMMSGQ